MKKYQLDTKSDLFEIIIPTGEGAGEDGLFDDCPLCQKLKQEIEKGYTARDKANFFRIARGSVFECVAILDVITRLKLTDCDLTSQFKKLEAIGRMLSGLINYVEGKKYQPTKETLGI